MRHFRLNKTTALLLIPVLIAVAILLYLLLRERPTVQANGPHVTEGFTLEVVAGPDMVDYPMFSTLDETGRLFVFESTGNVYDESEDAIRDPKFRIKLLQDTDADGIYDSSTIFADKVGFPQGGVFYKGSLYASSAPDLLKLTDTDNDGVADHREVVLSGWILNVNANSLIGPFMSPDGWLYMTNAIMGFDVNTKEGKRLKGETARIWRVRPNGTGLEWISAGGMNNPVELTFTAAAEPIGTETFFTNPKAGERDALVYWIEGGVYPKPNTNIDRDSLVRTGGLMPVVTKYSGVAPSGIARYRNTELGDDYQDNLFSAQFNTHKIIRHKLLRDGASFSTEDDDFFSSKNEDFHPTDVLEDADGSLLVVETGGWFIKGCPLSQVSKPQLKGSIYRVRRKGAKKIGDPYGNQIKWGGLPPAMVVKYLEDPRPFVRDRAVESLVDGGAASVGAVSKALLQSTSADTRTMAVFALYRIGTPEALASVRTGLNDANQQVRIAAARSVGLALDSQAVGRLIELVGRKDEPAVRRQAATALGQIGDQQAIPALLAAADSTADRFIRHAIIYSLVSMDQPDLIKQGLTSASAKVQEAALIALDQMPSSTLDASQLTPFLTSGNIELQQTALWVAAHHPEWSKDMISFLSNRFKGGTLNEDEKKLFGDILVSFCGDAAMQQFMANQMKGASKNQKLFLMKAMRNCEIKKFPPVWIDQVGKQLASTIDPQVKAAAMELIRLREINTLARNLREVVNDAKNLPELRIEAIAALLKAKPGFTDQDFAYIYSLLKTGNEASLRQQVAVLLGQGQLTEGQLKKLATEFLPQADAFILPRLVPAFEGAHSIDIGKVLASTLTSSPSLDGFTEESLKKLFENYPAEVKPSIDQLMAKLSEVRAGRLKRIQDFESQISKGVLERGRTLFFGKAVCFSCHTLGTQGGNFGPDLTSIQRIRSAHDLLEAIVYIIQIPLSKLAAQGSLYHGVLLPGE